MTMTRNDPDERFDVVDVSRRGAHRARPNPVTGLLPLVALAVVVFAVVGVAVSEPKNGTVLLTPQPSRGVIETKWTARVSTVAGT